MAANIVSVTYEDSEGKRKSEAFYLPTSINTVAGVETQADALVLLLDDVTGCEIVSAKVEFELTLPAGIKASPDANSRCDAGATLSFRNSESRALSLYIPGFLTSKMAGDVVQSGDTEVAALIAGIIIGGSWTDANQLALESYAKGKQTTRKNA